ncbi:low molecular weight phosphatase family protein [Maribacter sp. 4G9]|uniref:arsenate-mycothiol transferase ArsC n=1 Tax=Maribacter sp. 4G9 TaxID=1889777 RepID=UPI000C14F5DE|nr:protein-tyrosine-phosphatase [Maribacter sp. 4G9]PIB26993.1 protein-tyrosine-phosphatase [Maribacter sp. 4G9]
MFKELKSHIKELRGYMPDAGRLAILQSLIEYIQEKRDEGEPINLNFVCTHNSRRSHLSQIWAQAMAAYFDIPKVYSYSGGTEATALFPKVVDTLEGSGFRINKILEGENPVYAIKYGANSSPIVGFSKTYDAAFNPESNFAAVMTCGHADENCPFIPGAEKRIPMTFDDPKDYDGTELQTQKYRERSLEIASQLYYVFSKIV